MSGGEPPGVADQRDPIGGERTRGNGVRIAAGQVGSTDRAEFWVDTPEAGTEPSGGDVDDGAVGGDVLQGDDPGRVDGGGSGLQVQFDIADDVERLRQRGTGPLQESGWVGLARPGPAQSRSERHERPLAGGSLVVPEFAVAAKAQRAADNACGWPGVAGVPVVGARQPVSDGGAVEDAGFPVLQPVVEPGEGLDVQALPRPGQTELAEHPD